MTKKISHQIDLFPKNRQLIVEAINMSKYYNHIVGFMDADVTDAVKIFADYKEKSNESISFTAWIMRCIAKAASENKIVQTFRWKKWKTVTFDDVDIKCMIEREIGGRKIPIHYIFREADKKTFKELNQELRKIQTKIEEKREKEQKIKNRQQLLMRIPYFIRRIVWHSIMTNPFKNKENLGTIGLSTVGTFAKGLDGWAYSKTPHQTQFLIGAIIKKPIPKGDSFEFRDFLNLTVTMNHDIVDGGPAVKFARRVSELIEASFELEEFR